MLNDGDIPASRAKVRCFGASAALTAEASPLMVKGVASGWTVNFELAPRVGDQYDWDQKIMVQLSDTELPIVAAVCLGYLPKAKVSRNGKGVHIERQPGKIFISATQGAGKNFALPIPIGQTFQLSSLILAQLHRQVGYLDAELLIPALRGAAGLYNLPPQE